MLEAIKEPDKKREEHSTFRGPVSVGWRLELGRIAFIVRWLHTGRLLHTARLPPTSQFYNGLPTQVMHKGLAHVSKRSS